MANNSKRILLFSSAYLPLIGGAELALQAITDRLPDFEFDLITAHIDPKSPNYEKINNVNVFRAGKTLIGINLLLPKIFFPIAAFFKGIQLMRKQKYDILFALQASQAAGAAWFLRWFYDIPFVLNIQEGKALEEQSFLIRLFRRIIIKRADYIVAISHYISDVVKRIGIDKNKITVIPNGVANVFFDQTREYERTELKSSLGLSSEDKIIISVSRLVKKNGIDILIQAFQHVNNKNSILLLLGDGPDRRILQLLVEELGLKKRVLFLGTIEPQAVPNYLAIADIFVRPSRSEGLGSAFLEAMAARVPVVATPVGGIVDFLQDGQTGLFAESEDPVSVAHAIDKILSSPAFSESLVKNALDLVQSKYTWDIVAEKYRQLFLRL